MIDTCQANTMYGAFYTPNIVATGSSAIHQSSYSHHADQDVGVAVIDRWTYYNLDFLESQCTSTSSNVTLGELFDSYDPVKVHSDAGIRYDLFAGGEPEARKRRVVDFFGNVQGVEVDDVKSQADTFADWKNDLDALRKIVERQKEALDTTQDESQKLVAEPARGSDEAQINSQDRDNRLFHGAISLGNAEGWSKQMLGAGALFSITALWCIVSWVDR